MFRLMFSLLLSMHLLLPVAAWAEMRIKDPLDYSLKTYGLILGIALLGGLVNWYARVKKGEVSAFALNYLVGELTTSAFAGLLCFWLCEAAGSPPLLTAALAGIGGHMGTKALTLIEEWGVKRASKALS